MMRHETYCSPDCEILLNVYASSFCETSAFTSTEEFNNLTDLEW